MILDFNLSNARRFYSSKGGPLGVKGLSFPRVGYVCFQTEARYRLHQMFLYKNNNNIKYFLVDLALHELEILWVLYYVLF